MKTISKLEKSKYFWFLVLASFIFFLLRWPSLYEPYWYGDEGVYQAVGILINSGEKLYSGAWENKPPLLPVLYALFNSDQFILRGLSLISGLVSVWFFLLAAMKLFPKSKYATIIATSIYVFLFGTRLIEGNIANAENFMILPIMASAFLIISNENFKKTLNYKIYLLAGFLLSISFLIKTVAVFDFLAFFTALLIYKDLSLKEKIKERIIPLTLGFSIPIFLIMFYFLTTQNFKDFMDALLLQNLAYVGYANEFLFPQGLLFIKGVLLLFFIIALYLYRKKLSMNVLFIFLWFGFSLFNVFFSGRAYTHYLITLLPSFCLMIGLAIEERKIRIPTVSALVVGSMLIYFTFNLKFEVLSYYTNVISFFAGQKSVAEYQSYFDPNTPRDYEIARYIKINTSSDDKVFIWGNNAQVYKLTGKTPLIRYTVTYHIINFPKGFSEMEEAIENEKPKLIVVMPNVPQFPFGLENYTEIMDIGGAMIYEKVL
ncbi:MAG: hypothetical protein US96_C0027G0014 [Candidatus Woesebacteria bacterium GW2011_GWB1_38_5b]|uniref:Glycosyltransferase RgtA/B/C/D-like domain-containing protein n=1 Tax=Candidatus Woesebacteria bacterium GW2011_GWB1_38_5b TaxID=1618569 RepID=A0A0G0KGX4_9BACT|nr:MAG: hypothetical protein US96_C0027G0014 [Candidatus Woesebacteria bacterium GW2011_GWB1_38_5b]OGH48200.1 MAG: hypothetical protein A3A51_04210 [Candidatus Levybacteria bacterium RIFCSPLOWO2_01_FULL_39_10]